LKHDGNDSAKPLKSKLANILGGGGNKGPSRARKRGYSDFDNLNFLEFQNNQKQAVSRATTKTFKKSKNKLKLGKT